MKQLAQFTLTLPLLLACLSIGTVQAQYYQNYSQNNYYQQAQHVTVYEDCGFRGKSRALVAGDYRNVRDINIGNDSISSISVPEGFEIILYEHEDLRGKSTIISRDVNCLSKGWNDQASSLRVQSDGRYNNNLPGNAKNYTRHIRSIGFANTFIEQTSQNRWEYQNVDNSVQHYRETYRDENVIYLQNTRVNQQTQINLRDQVIRFLPANGPTVEYRITSTSEQLRNRTTSKNNNTDRATARIHSNCFTYKAYTQGGQGGLRFHGKDGFHQFSRKPITGRICHDGILTMEMNKKALDTHLVVEINNQRFRFGRNEREDKLLNTWYRKSIKLNVGK